MHIGIDVREACHTQKTGKGQWSRSFVDALLLHPIELTLYTDAALPPSWQQLCDKRPDRLRVRRFPHGVQWHVRTALSLRSASDIDVYVSPTSYIVPFLIGKRMKVVPVVHDLIALQDSTHEKKASLIERWTLPHALLSAYRICTVSAATKNDLLEHFSSIASKKIFVILAAATTDAVMERHSDGKTILSIGTLCPRKNQLRLIEAFVSLPLNIRRSFQLILIGGRGWRDEAIVHRAADEPHVQWLGYRSDRECMEYLSRALIFAYPSLYEGFGLPVLDAMRMGVPVLCSDRGSLAEVVGDAAELVDPESIDSIHDGLLRLLTCDQRREKLSAAGKKRASLFSWQRTVDLFLAAI